ncbi:universal stress protein [Klebsiella sp. K794]|nr:MULTISPECIES: universal stress protein [Enterobacteriaceae]EBA8545687.1 universal stress protein [Salmonella enterica]EBB7595281.1 universal stress protein [Salmonella enterica subsp. enterica serovar Schwarzengrund]ESG88167.1 UspA domain-containing protein [Salmonella enterica subsp. enterica serovar Kentucky str. ATCC 9263]HCM6828361.1 universal stress protein [Klebsiella quasipneumoniae subsp. quasipneumoniae]EBB7604646.1 universal stress protein [Salmonella enterica subsp. enterica sero
MMNRILVAYDGSDPAKEAMSFASELARHYNSELYVIAVCQLPEFGGEVEMQDFVSRTQSYFNQMMRNLKKQYPELKKDTKFHVAMGHPAEQILRYADTHSIDHIVVGHRGKTLFSRWLLGSVARQVVDHALCPVTVVRK